MLIYINDQPHHQISDSSSLHLLLGQLALPMKGIAVAVNGEVVPNRLWPDYRLQENDKIILIKATQGG